MKLSEIAFFTEHVQQMTDFYRRLLNLEPVSSSETMSIFLVGDTKFFIHFKYDAKQGELPPENHYAFAVENVDEICGQLLDQGLELEIDPQDFYWGRSAYMRDQMGIRSRSHK